MGDKQNADQELASFVRQAKTYLKYIENPVWHASGDLTDENHAFDLFLRLAEARRKEGLPDHTSMHSICNKETGETLLLVGNTPEAEERAKFLTCMMAALPRLLECIDVLQVCEQELAGRVTELTESNDRKLMENREQRKQIYQLEQRVDSLLKIIPPGSSVTGGSNGNYH